MQLVTMRQPVFKRRCGNLSELMEPGPGFSKVVCEECVCGKSPNRKPVGIDFRVISGRLQVLR